MEIDLDKIFEEVNGIRIGVIGDLMLDTYWWGNVERISPEGPVPVVSVTKKEMRIGGAGNVCLNIKTMGAEVTILSVIGRDEEGEEIKNLLLDNKINTRFLISSKKRITTNKIRIISRNQQMMRLDAEQCDDIDATLEDELEIKLAKYIHEEKPHVIILQDYNKGVLTERIINTVIEICKENTIISAADPKKKNFFAYAGVDIFKPNLKEVKESLHILTDNADQAMLTDIHVRLSENLHHYISFITLSEKGIFYQYEDEADIIPAHVRSVADVSGAGDTVIAVASLLYAVTKNVRFTARLANLAAGLVCEEVGTAAINKNKLYDECMLWYPELKADYNEEL